MAQREKNTVDYFPHFTNASSGKTITTLEKKYGDTGYAFWFKLLEVLASSEGHYITCSLLVDWEYLNGRLGVGYEKATEVLDDLSSLGAIDKNLWEKAKIVWSDNFILNVAAVYKNRKRTPPQKPPIPQSTHSLPVIYGKPTGRLPPQSRVENSIVKESSRETDQPQQQEPIFNLYENFIGTFDGHMAETLKDAEKQFTHQQIAYAFQEAREKNVRNWKFIYTILKRLKAEGIINPVKPPEATPGNDDGQYEFSGRKLKMMLE